MTIENEIRDLSRIRLRRAAFAVTVGLLAFGLIGFYAFPNSNLPWKALLLAWCALYATTTLLCVFSRCPRCQHLFHSVYPTHNPLSRSCSGCGSSLSARASWSGKSGDEPIA